MLTYPGEEHAARHQGFVGLRWRMCIWHNNALTLLGMLHSLQSFRFSVSKRMFFGTLGTQPRPDNGRLPSYSKGLKMFSSSATFKSSKVLALVC